MRWDSTLLDSPKPQASPRKPKRYRLVASRVEAHGARIKRLRLAQLDAIARLEPPARAPRTAR
jgi:hypothetical protein